MSIQFVWLGNIMRQETRKKIDLRTFLCCFSIAVLALSLIPLFMISKFNYEYGDDTIFSASVVQVRKTDPSFKATVAEAVNVAIETRNRWQGTFAAAFFDALQPGVFGRQVYSITAYIMIGALLFSTGFLSYTLLSRVLRAEKRTWLIVSSLVVFLSVQLAVSAREAFFWYSGAMLYTLFHSLFLLLVSLILNMFLSRRVGWKIALAILSIILAFIVSGGNYATIMVCGELLLFALVYAAIKKSRFELFAIIVILAVFGVGMWFSIAAPGNVLRQSAVIDSAYMPSGPVQAIALSLAYSAYFGLEWFDIACFSVALMTAFLVAPALKKTKFAFRYPLILAIVSFGMFASLFTPSAFAASSPGPYRLRNIAYFTFLLFVELNTVYLTGWMIKKRAAVAENEPLKESLLLGAGFKRVYVAAAVILCALFIGAGLVQRGVENLPSVISVIELRDGTAVTHARERLSRINGTDFDDSDFTESRILS